MEQDRFYTIPGAEDTADYAQEINITDALLAKNRELLIKETDFLADMHIKIAKKFKQELKGEFTNKQITSMICAVYGILGGN